MSPRTGTFDVNKFIVVFGTATIRGFEKDSFVKIALKEDTINATQGVDGETTRVITGKNLATITFNLMQSSLSNDYLSSVHLADKTGNIPLPLLIKDLKGNTIVSSLAAWVVKYVDLDYGSEAKSREWILNGNIDQFIGGNQL